MNREVQFNEKVATYISHDVDLMFTIVADVHEYHIDFRVYDIMYLDEANGNDPVWAKSGDDSYQRAESLEEAQVFLHGFVKWDGCSNWHIDEQDDCMIHACSREELLRIGQVMAECWDQTARECPKWWGDE